METRELSNLIESNVELAEAYLKVLRPYSRDMKVYNRKAEDIRTSRVDIKAYFETNGTLKGLNASSIGPKTLKILESILSKGVRGAMDEKIEEERQSLDEFAGV
jgi:hypothetical protein